MIAPVPSGAEMKRQAASERQPAFSFVNTRPESAMMIKQSLKMRRRIQSCYTFVGSNYVTDDRSNLRERYL
jgi:hypothetical protein